MLAELEFHFGRYRRPASQLHVSRRPERPATSRSEAASVNRLLGAMRAMVIDSLVVGIAPEVRGGARAVPARGSQ